MSGHLVRTLAIVALALGLARSAAAQTKPPRDANATPPGTAILSGVVLTDEMSPRPLRRATVVLSSGDIRFPQSTTTDDAGRFAFARLTAGNYSIVGTKPGYVASYYGAKRAGRGPGVPIAVLDGQQVADVTLKMMHGGVIAGTITGPSGRPAESTNVVIYRVDNVGGARRLSLTSTSANTDDRGMYRAFGLAPGDYVVQVGGTLASFALNGEARLVTPAEVRWADQAGPAAAPPPGQTVSYSSVYFPGTSDVSAATIVTLGPAEERDGVDFALALVPTARLSGQVLDADGRPLPGAQITVAPAGATQDLMSMFGSIRSQSRSTPDGTFTVSGVTPGAYTISVRATPPSAGGRGGSQDAAMLAAARMLGGVGGNTPSLWANADVAVDGRDMSDILLRLQPGMTVTGKLVFESSSTSTQPPDVTRARIALMAPPTGSSAIELTASMLTGTMQATIAPDSTFTVLGVTPGKYRVSTGGLAMLMGQTAVAAGWTMKSAMLGGRDVADVPFDVRPNEDVANLVVTVTDHPSELSGTVRDRAGRPAPGFPFVVFSTDRGYWTIGSRRVQQARPSSDGKYTLTGLPAGEYYVCALTDLDQNQLYDPSFLESLLPGSFKITIGDGEKKMQDLTLAGGS
jgi:Carboxypeptidase regulatory-like domain